MDEREVWIQKYIQQQIGGMTFGSEVERQHMMQQARQSAEAYIQAHQGRSQGNPQQETDILGVPIRELMKYEGLKDARFQALRTSNEQAKHYYEQMKIMKASYPNIENALREYNRQIDEVLERIRK